MNNKVYYIAITAEVPQKGKATAIKTIYTTSQNQNIEGVKNSKADMSRLKAALKSDKFTIIEVDPIRILSGEVE